MEISTALVLTLGALLATVPSAAADRLTYNLSYSLPIVVVFVALVVIITVIVCVMYRAKQGYFCCLSPRVTYRVRETRRANHEESGRTPNAAQTNGAPAPAYRTVPTNTNIAPPDYVDALHDVIVPEGEQQPAPPGYSENTQSTTDQPADPPQQTPLREVDLNDDSTESYDDTTPLNP